MVPSTRVEGAGEMLVGPSFTTFGEIAHQVSMGSTTLDDQRRRTKIEAEDVGAVALRIVTADDDEQVPDHSCSVIGSTTRAKIRWRGESVPDLGL